LEGIRSVHVDVPAQHVSVEYDETMIGLEGIKEVLFDEEYPVAAVSEQGR
jgi:copper chaperone CopZ